MARREGVGYRPGRAAVGRRDGMKRMKESRGGEGGRFRGRRWGSQGRVGSCPGWPPSTCRAGCWRIGITRKEDATVNGTESIHNSLSIEGPPCVQETDSRGKTLDR